MEVKKNKTTKQLESTFKDNYKATQGKRDIPWHELRDSQVVSKGVHASNAVPNFFGFTT